MPNQNSFQNSLYKKLKEIHNEWLNGEEITQDDFNLFKKCYDKAMLEREAISLYLWKNN